MVFTTVASPAEDPQRETLADGCVRELWSLPSPSMGRPIRVAVLIPPGEAKSLPLLYALHGRGAPYLSFTEMKGLRAFVTKHPMLVVTFDGDKDSAYIDATHRPQSLFTTFFFNELMPEINRRYPVSGKVGVTGFSMGGYGALHYMLERPDAFVAVSGMSTAPNFIAVNSDDSRGRSGAKDLLGPAEENAAAYARLALVPRLTAAAEASTPLPPILLTCGTEDFMLKGNRQFVDFLATTNRKYLPPAEEGKPAKTAKDYRLRFTYQESPGAHDWGYWSEQSAVIAEFHWRQFQVGK